MAKKNPIKLKKFDKKANLKHVKDRSQYPVVKQYERDFKHNFGIELGNMAASIVSNTRKYLKRNNEPKPTKT